MKPFQYIRPESLAEAVSLSAPGSRYIAGGTNLVDLMKEEVEQPERLIDISHLPLREVKEKEDGGLRIGALVTNAELARHCRVKQSYPLLSRALLSGASPQLRNMATVGGNLLQRTRCHYFYDTATPCNKRNPGSGCSARQGLNRSHAILGGSEHCVAVHPSDMAVALAALGAQILVEGHDGQRQLPVTDLYRLPGDKPERDTTLMEGDLITAVELPPPRFAQHSAFIKVRDRASYTFALVSVAAALELAEGTVTGAGLALGGVSHKPWQRRSAEDSLIGRQPETAAFEAAAEALLAGAQPLEHNDFKITLARRAVVRALTAAAGGVHHD